MQKQHVLAFIFYLDVVMSVVVVVKLLWCRSGAFIPSVRRETQQPAESEWWQHGLLHGRRHTSAYSVEIIGDYPEPSVLLARVEM